MDVDLAGNDVVIGAGIIEVVKGQLDVDPGRMRIDPFDVDYRGADIEGGFTMDARDVPRMSVHAKALSFDLGDLLRRMGADAEARGRLDLQLELTATGSSAREMATTADGRLSVLMHEGMLGRVNLNLRLTQLVGNLVRSEPEDLLVRCLMVDLPVTDGLGRLNLFVLETDEMLMRGEGKIDFGADRFDLLLLPRPHRGRTLAHNANVRITGPLREPRYRLDARDTATTVAGAVGRFALLGPGGLFLSRNTFQNDRAECAATLEAVANSP